MIYGLWLGCMCVHVCLDGGQEVNPSVCTCLLVCLRVRLNVKW